MALFFVMGALIVGVGITGAFEVSQKWTAVGLFGIASVYPALIVRPARIYGLLVYFFALMLEPIGKSLDKYFVDVASFAKYGIAPSGDVAIMLWPSDIVLFFLVATLLLRKLAGGGSIYFPRAVFLIVTFFLWAALVSVLYSPVLYLSIGELFRFLRFMLVFVYAANAIDSERVVRWFIVILFTCLVLQSLIVVGMFLAGATGSPLSFIFSLVSTGGYVESFENTATVTEEDSGLRAVGTIGNAVWLAMFFEFIVPLAFVYFWMAKRLLPKLIYLGLFGLGCAAFVLTFSRMALISLGFGLGIAFLLLLLRRRLTAIVVVPLLLLSVTATMAVSPYLYDYMTTRPENVSKRIPLMIKAVKMIVSDPFIGVGLNNHTVVKAEMFEEDVAGEQYSPVHNHYLSLATEVGLFGIGLQIAFFAVVLVEAVRRTRSEVFIVQVYAIAAVATLATLYAHWLGDNFAGHVVRAMYFFLAGSVFALRGIERRSRARELGPSPAPMPAGHRDTAHIAGPAGHAAPS